MNERSKKRKNIERERIEITNKKRKLSQEVDLIFTLLSTDLNTNTCQVEMKVRDEARLDALMRQICPSNKNKAYVWDAVDITCKKPKKISTITLKDKKAAYISIFSGEEFVLRYLLAVIGMTQGDGKRRHLTWRFYNQNGKLIWAVLDKKDNPFIVDSNVHIKERHENPFSINTPFLKNETSEELPSISYNAADGSHMDSNVSPSNLSQMSFYPFNPNTSFEVQQNNNFFIQQSNFINGKNDPYLQTGYGQGNVFQSFSVNQNSHYPLNYSVQWMPCLFIKGNEANNNKKAEKIHENEEVNSCSHHDAQNTMQGDTSNNILGVNQSCFFSGNNVYQSPSHQKTNDKNSIDANNAPQKIYELMDKFESPIFSPLLKQGQELDNDPLNDKFFFDFKLEM